MQLLWRVFRNQFLRLGFKSPNDAIRAKAEDVLDELSVIISRDDTENQTITTDVYYKPINMATTSLKKSDPAEDLYSNLLLLLWHRLSDSKKHKAYYLFSVLFSEEYYYENNVSLVKDAVRNNTLELLREGCRPNDKYDDNIVIYFLDEGEGKYFIVLLYNPVDWYEDRRILGIIPVKRNDYQMTQIFPLQKAPRRSNISTNI